MSESAPAPIEPIEAIALRIATITEWLRENAPYVAHDQNHLNADSVERAYWHYGYLVALRDVRKLIGSEPPAG